MASQFRILQIINRIPFPLNDGGNIAAWYVAHYLKKFGHSVDLAFLNTNKHHEAPQSIAAGYRNFFYTDINTNITVTGLLKSFFSETAYNIERFRSKEFEKVLTNALKENEYDFIQIEGAYMALYIPLLRRLSNAKIVLRSHNIEHQIWERLALHTTNPLKKVFIQQLAKKIKTFEETTLHQFDAIVAITPDDEAYYRSKNYKGKLTTIQAGFEDSLIQNPVKKPYSVCFIGSMQWMPNTEGIEWFLKEVWPLVLKEVPEAKFYIAGKGMDASFDKWNRPGVILEGLVPNASDFIQNHNVFVVPLRSGGGMRLKVVEAMGMCMPIVSTTIGAEGIHCIPNEDILICDTPTELKNGIVLLLQNEALARQIAQHARNRAVSEYSWETLISGFEKMYKELE
ncbi:glycosyltransferase family 4 protein [Cytophaga aurantiaca]|uniref:glycosyltransferase family 4 protein n=1 Tax=Cytophaga aurantiaca TaxID=29530 RepID=UPI00037C3658|nr:glycosyltransferase family 4 protein [Cytophaga aurantiaca]